MFAYNLRLALRSMRRNPFLTALMIGAIGIGIGVSTTTLTVYHLRSGNPIPEKSDQLYAVQLDSWSSEEPYGNSADHLPTQVTYRDANNLMRAAQAPHQNASFIVSMTVQPENKNQKPSNITTRATYNDFFEMFDVPFAYGGAWPDAANENGEQVVVLGQSLNEKLFGGANSVGKEVVLDNSRFRVVGVLRRWQPTPKFYDLENDRFGDSEDAYIPLDLTVPLQLHTAGNNSCWGGQSDKSFQGYLNSECVWLQFWVELPSTAAREKYHRFLDNYVRDQKKAGRFPRPVKTSLRNVMQWIAYHGVVGNDSRSLVGLAFMFLLVCLLNTIGLILAKFMRRSGEIGLRRALGASKGALFRQYLVEAGVIGVAGGVLGLLLGWLGLLGMRHLYDDSARLAHLDWTMIGASLLLAIVASVIAGLYPAWRVIRIAPAAYLKTQ